LYEKFTNTIFFYTHKGNSNIDNSVFLNILFKCENMKKDEVGKPMILEIPVSGFLPPMWDNNEKKTNMP
jgi:hypothetical protein